MLFIPVELFRRCRNCEESAWAELLSLTGDYLMRIAIANLQDHRHAEDVVQETYLIAFRKISNVRNEGTFGAWLTRVLINECRALQRARKSLKKLDALDVDLSLLASRAGADSGFAFEETVMELLRRIPPIFREPLILREMEDLDYAEISKVLGVPIGTVRSRIARGRKLWQELLKANYGGAENNVSPILGGRSAVP